MLDVMLGQAAGPVGIPEASSSPQAFIGSVQRSNNGSAGLMQQQGTSGNRCGGSWSVVDQQGGRNRSSKCSVFISFR
jgi:hypothetical protein